MSNQCFFPLCTPQKAICPLTVLFTPQKAISSRTVEKSTVRSDMAFWGVNSGKKHCKGAYGFLGSTQWKKALIAHLLPKKPPSRKSHQFEVTLVPQVLMSKQIKNLSPRCIILEVWGPYRTTPLSCYYCTRDMYFY